VRVPTVDPPEDLVLRTDPPPAGPRRWCLATRLLVAAAGAWLLFVVAQRLLSGRAWLWLLPDLMPPPVLAVAPVVLLAALGVARAAGRPVPRRARWITAGAALAALVLGWGQSGFRLGALVRSDPPIPPTASGSCPGTPCTGIRRTTPRASTTT